MNLFGTRVGRLWRSLQRGAQRRQGTGQFARLELLESRVLLTALNVTSESPLPNSFSAAPNTNVAVTFDQTLNAGTVTDQSFVVQGSQTGSLLTPANVLSVSGSTITLDPVAEMATQPTAAM